MSRSASGEREPLLSHQDAQLSSEQVSNGRIKKANLTNSNEADDEGGNATETTIITSDAHQNGDISQQSNGSEEAIPTKPDEQSTIQLLSTVSGAFLGAFLCALDSTLVATLSASISSSFSNMPLLGLLGSAFFIAAAASQPIAGKLSDIFGRRNCLLVASVVFALGNIICATARQEWQLLLGRLVSGLGGGAVYPIVTIVLSDLIPLRRRGVWQGIGNICFTLGSGIGGPFGGWIDDLYGWRWAFTIQVPITVISMALIIWRLDLPSDRKAKLRTDSTGTQQSDDDNRLTKLKRVDFVGAILSVVCIVLLLTGLSSGGRLLPWNHPLILAALAASVVMLAVFIAYEYKIAKDPIIPVAQVYDRTIAAVYLANWLHPMARFGLQFYAPIYFQVRGYSAGQTGLRLLPDSLAVGIGAVGSGLIMRITGKYYFLSITQQLALPIGIALFSTLTLSTPAWPPFIYMFLPGFGFSAMLTTTLLALLATVEPQHMASMTSALFVFRSTGSVIGISAASAVYQNTLNHQLHRRLDHLPDSTNLIHEIQQSLSKMFDLPDPLKRSVQEAYMESLRVVYIMLTAFAVLGVCSSALMRERPLPTKLARR